jgi:hypothetical protein
MKPYCFECGGHGEIKTFWDSWGNNQWLCTKCFEDKYKTVKCSDGQYRTIKELKELGIWER